MTHRGSVKAGKEYPSPSNRGWKYSKWLTGAASLMKNACPDTGGLEAPDEAKWLEDPKQGLDATVEGNVFIDFESTVGSLDAKVL